MARKKAASVALSPTNGLEPPEVEKTERPGQGGYLVYFAVPAVAVTHFHIKGVASPQAAEQEAWKLLQRNLPILGLSTFRVQGDPAQIRLERVVKHSEAEHQALKDIFLTGKLSQDSAEH